MISDWTIYGYVGDGAAYCPACFSERVSDDAVYTHGGTLVREPAEDDTEDGEVWQGLLSISDTGEGGLSCDQCGAYIFEPDPDYEHSEYGHDEAVDGCDACAAIDAQLEQWADEHDRGEHATEPVLATVTVRDRWVTTVTRGGCRDCEREYAPADGQLGLQGTCPNGHVNRCVTAGDGMRACLDCDYVGVELGGHLNG